MPFALDDVLKSCSNKFGTADICFFSPGRANIIGEHTDYTNGFVLPFATEQGIFFAAKIVKEKKLTVFSLETNEMASFSLDSTAFTDTSGWKLYVAQVLQRINYTALPFGLNITLGGTLPLGAGMSSSSSLTCGLLALLNDVYKLNFSKNDLVSMAVEAEHGTGVQGGMMDQYTIFNGSQNFALYLDCLSLSHENVAIKLKDYGFYLVNTNVKHKLSDSPYNQRRQECEQALQEIRFHANDKTIQYRDYNGFTKYADSLDPILFQRARHVFSENKRVLDMTLALAKNDVFKIGTLLTESHYSLSEDYQVSCEELDFLIRSSENYPGWMGGRMMGGGFGGCTINLIQLDKLPAYMDHIKESYFLQFGIQATFIPVQPSEGLHQIRL